MPVSRVCAIFRYQFRNNKRCGLQELGPRFTLKLRSLQRGTFDSKFGEYEWVHKVRLEIWHGRPQGGSGGTCPPPFLEFEKRRHMMRCYEKLIILFIESVLALIDKVLMYSTALCILVFLFQRKEMDTSRRKFHL